MFDQVKGNIVKKHGNENVLQVLGSGFFIKFMSPTSSNIADIDEETDIFLHNSMKDVNGTIQQTYFGFAKEEERDFFMKLISIKGIGDKMAIAILSFYTPGELITIIREKDSKSLSKVPKIGAKSAEKFLLDMDKLIDPVFISKFSSNNSDISSKYTSEDIISEAISALKALGISDADKTVAKLSGESIYTESGTLIKDCLKERKK